MTWIDAHHMQEGDTSESIGSPSVAIGFVTKETDEGMRLAQNLDIPDHDHEDFKVRFTLDIPAGMIVEVVDLPW